MEYLSPVYMFEESMIEKLLIHVDTMVYLCSGKTGSSLIQAMGLGTKQVPRLYLNQCWIITYMTLFNTSQYPEYHTLSIRKII